MAKSRLKFSNTKHSDFTKELRHKVKLYFEEHQIPTYGNFSLIAKSVFMLSLYLVPFVFVLTGMASSAWSILLSFAIMGLGMAGVGMVLMHDANHGAFSKHKWMNHFLSKSMYFLGGYPANWRFQHNSLHHGFTNVDGHDEDISPVGILRFSPHKPIYKIHRFQHFYAWFFYGLMTISWSLYRDFIQLFRYNNEHKNAFTKKTLAFHLVDLSIAKVLYFGVFIVFPIILYPGNWGMIFLGFLLMHFISGFLLGIIFQTAHVMPSTKFPMADDNNILENNWTVHQLSTTTNYSPKSKWFSWLIGGLNYQVEHHLFPQISHVHYSKISKIVRETAEKYGIPYYVEPSFALALKNHYFMLKKLGR
jgi:linoleoyl-CoA desaturase